MVISTLLGVYYELTPAELVVPGSVVSLYHVFTPLILTAARWGGAYGYPCSQMGKLGFRELRCFADLPITVSPPWLGVGMWPKSGFWESLRNSSVEPCKELCPSAPMVSRGWPCRPTPHGGSQSAAGEPRTHTQSSREKNHLPTPQGLSPQLCCSSVLLSYVSCSILSCLMSFELDFCHL